MKKSLTLLGALAACFALVATVTFAEDVITTTKAPIRQEIKKEVRADIGSIKASSTEERQRLQAELKKKADEARAEFTKKRGEAQKEIEKIREEFRGQIAEKKAEVKKNIAEKRLELSEKLKVVKDEKKQQTALKVGDQFQQINAKVLANLTNILTREEAILQKISSRADILALQNADITELKAGIVTANASLAKAREAIVAQTAKIYTIAVKSEAALKNDTGITRQQLEGDLNNVRNQVKAVHESIKNIADIFEKIPGVEKLRVMQNTNSTSSSTNQ